MAIVPVQVSALGAVRLSALGARRLADGGSGGGGYPGPGVWAGKRVFKVVPGAGVVWGWDPNRPGGTQYPYVVAVAATPDGSRMYVGGSQYLFAVDVGSATHNAWLRTPPHPIQRIRVDSNGNIWAGGTSNLLGGTSGISKYSPTGTLIWQKLNAASVYSLTGDWDLDGGDWLWAQWPTMMDSNGNIVTQANPAGGFFPPPTGVSPTPFPNAAKCWFFTADGFPTPRVLQYGSHAVTPNPVTVNMPLTDGWNVVPRLMRHTTANRIIGSATMTKAGQPNYNAMVALNANLQVVSHTRDTLGSYTGVAGFARLRLDTSPDGGLTAVVYESTNVTPVLKRQHLVLLDGNLNVLNIYQLATPSDGASVPFVTHVSVPSDEMAFVVVDALQSFF